MVSNYLTDYSYQALEIIPKSSYEQGSADLKYSAEHSCINLFQQEETNDE
jgi:hypothetical protein